MNCTSRKRRDGLSRQPSTPTSAASPSYEKIGPTARVTAYAWYQLGMPYGHLFVTPEGAAMYWGFTSTAGMVGRQSQARRHGSHLGWCVAAQEVQIVPGLAQRDHLRCGPGAQSFLASQNGQDLVVAGEHRAASLVVGPSKAPPPTAPS